MKVNTQSAIFGGGHDGRNEKLQNAIQTKDPMKLGSFEEKAASIDAKLIRLNADPRYKALNPSQRVATRAQIYNKYVVPSFQAAGLQAPDIKTWLKGTKETDAINPGDNFRTQTGDVVARTVASATNAAEGLTLFGAKVTRQFFREAYGLAEYFTGPTEETYSEARQEGIKTADAGMMGKVVKSTQDAMHQSEFWLQTHPRQSMLATAAGWAGEQVVQLPIYEALGAAGVASKVVGKVPLTAKLLSSPVGSFAVRRLNDAFAGFASNVVTTGDEASTKENLGAAAGFAMFGTLGEGLGSWFKRLTKAKPLEGEYVKPIKTASDSSIKKLTANVLSMGGHPFQADVIDTSFHELTVGEQKLLTSGKTDTGEKINDFVGRAMKRDYMESMGQDILDHMDEHNISPKQVSDTFWKDTYFKLPAEGQQMIQRYLSKLTSFKPGDSIGTAADGSNIIAKDWHDIAQLTGDAAKVQYLEGTERGYVAIMKEAIDRYGSSHVPVNPVEMHKLDPVLGQLKTGEHMALQSLALRSYGMPLHELPPEYQQKVLARRYELLEEAKYELPVHVPDLNRAEIVGNIKSQIENNPELAKSVDSLKKMFNIDVADVVNKNQIEDIKIQTGIKNTTKAAKKVNSGSDKLKEIAKKDAITPRDFAQHKLDTAAYFKKAPGPRKAADGTLIGGRDKRSWNERLKAENTKEFIETLKEADGNRIKFENPYHRMLFHWANRDRLPTVLQEKLFRELKKAQPELKKPDFNQQADRLGQHLQMLAQAGRLTKDKNVFKSTKVNSEAFTQWQSELNTELDKQELQFLAKTIDQHPAGLQAMKGIVQIFQANRRMNLGKPEEWGLNNKVLSNIISGVID